MSALALLCAAGAAVSAALPWPGMFVAMALGIAAIGLGVVGWRRREAPGARRLAAAAAIVLGGLGLALGALRFTLTVLAIDKLEALLRGG